MEDALFLPGDFQEQVLLVGRDSQVLCQQGRDLVGGAPFIRFDFHNGCQGTSHQPGKLLLGQVKGLAPAFYPTSEGLVHGL